MTMVTMMMERIVWFTPWASRTVIQSVNQSFCHHSVDKNYPTHLNALTNVVEMNCIENLKSQREIHIKLKQIFQQTTGCHLNHLLIQMVPVRGSKTWREQNIDEAALKTSLIQPYSPCLKQHKNKLYHLSGVIRKWWSSEWAYAKTKEICHFIIHHQCMHQWPLFSLRTRSFQPNMTALHVNIPGGFSRR